MQEKIALFRVRLRVAMRRKRLSQAGLGASLSENVHRTTIGRWLKGEITPTAYQVIELGVILDVATRWLLGVSDEETHPIWPRTDQAAILRAYERLNLEGRKAILAAVEDASGAILKAGAT